MPPPAQPEISPPLTRICRLTWRPLAEGQQHDAEAEAISEARSGKVPFEFRRGVEFGILTPSSSLQNLYLTPARTT
jgi:hypothetical protein